MKETFFETIYFPMTCDLMHPGHIKCIKYLERRCKKLIIGLLTEQALKGYKKAIMSYQDRAFLLRALKGDFKVVPQESLNPESNLRRLNANAIASGDGWEADERKAIAHLNIEAIDIPLEKTYSSKIYKQRCKEF